VKGNGISSHVVTQYTVEQIWYMTSPHFTSLHSFTHPSPLFQVKWAPDQVRASASPVEFIDFLEMGTGISQTPCHAITAVPPNSETRQHTPPEQHTWREINSEHINQACMHRRMASTEK
jgi:hypothetical protein